MWRWHCKVWCTHQTWVYISRFQIINEKICPTPWGESMKKEPIMPRLKSFPRTAFFTWQIFIGLYYIFHIIWISNLKPNMTYIMIKIQFSLHQALHYSQIYNFTLNHDYKFKTIIVWKDILLKSKMVYVFLFFEFFEHIDPFLWNILKFTKNLNDLVNIW